MNRTSFTRKIMALLLLFLPILTNGQSNKLYTSVAESLQTPEKVIYLTLDFRTVTATDAQRLAELTNLKVLNLHYFKNDTLPNSIFQLKKLRELRVIGAGFFGDYKPKADGKHYFLRTIPAAIGNLKELEILDLSHNAIQTLPPTIGQLSRLKVLNVSGNSLKNLPASMAQLAQLQYLFLGRNGLKANLEVLQFLPSLVELNLNSNYIRTFPYSLSKLHRLKKLDLSDNELTQFPLAIINQLTNIESLNLNYNKFNTFPTEIFQLKKLKALQLAGAVGYDDQVRKERDELIRIVPDEIATLQRLEVLDLSYHFINHLPQAFSKLSKLKRLNLSGNYLHKDSITALTQINGLEELILSGNGLSDLPASFAGLTHLKHLEIGNNWLEGAPVGSSVDKFPAVILRLKNLETLMLTSQFLEEIPTEVAQLKNLKVLDLYGNLSTSLPESIGQLEQLEVLSLGLPYFGPFVPIAETPLTFTPWICQLKNLTELGLYNRKLAKGEKERLKNCLPLLDID